MEIKHFYCVLYWAPVKAAVQADVTGKVLIRKPYLSLVVHTRVDTQVEELDIHVNVYIPLFFSWLSQTGITLTIGPPIWLSRDRNLPPSLMTQKITGIHRAKRETHFNNLIADICINTVACTHPHSYMCLHVIHIIINNFKAIHIWWHNREDCME